MALLLPQAAVSDQNARYIAMITADPNLVSEVRKPSFRYERADRIIA